MPETDIGSTAIGNLEGTEEHYSVDPATTDRATDQKETEYINTNWTTQLGYYKKISPLKRSINAKATWTVGRGFKADPETTFTLLNIRGNGKDTTNTILKNLIRTYTIGGDSYAEIIRDKKLNLINLKPLSPEFVKIVANRKGIIIRYELIDKNGKTKNKFQPEEIFHLSRNRIADELHGESVIDTVTSIILAREEVMEDMRIAMHRHVKPLMGIPLDTDDPAEIAAFILMFDEAMRKGENIYWPKGVAEPSVIGVPQNATMNPLPWIDRLTNYFYEETGVPKIVIGGAQEFTESAGKIVYLSFEQDVKEDQLFIEEQVGMQLGLEIELEFPASLENDLITDKSKSETMQASTPEDTSITNVGVSPQPGAEQ